MADQVSADGTITETNKPVNTFAPSFQVAGQPTTPNLYRGVIEGTGIYFNNNDLAHACDIRFALSLNTSLGQLLNGLVPNLGPLLDAMKAGQNDAGKLVRGLISKLITELRIAVKGIQAAVNLDPSGELSRFWSSYKEVIRKINKYIKDAAQYVYDISYVIALVNYIKSIIAWIEQLPAYLQKLLQDCLKNFTNSLTNIATSIQQTAKNIQNVGPTAINTLLASATATQTSSQGNSNYSDNFTKTISDPLNSGVDAISSGISALAASAKATVSTSRSNTQTQKP
jgi:hypothetical protein